MQLAFFPCASMGSSSTRADAVGVACTAEREGIAWAAVLAVGMASGNGFCTYLEK